MEILGKALIPFLASIITAIVAFTGVYFTNKANNERLRLQLEYEKEIKKKELTRDRAEELYELVDVWLQGMFVNYLNLSFVMEGKFDYNQYLDQIIEHGNKSEHNFTRLQMIIKVYFQELLPTYNDLIEIRSELNNISTEHKRAYERGGFDGQEFLKPYASLQFKFEKTGGRLKDEIAECAKST